MKRTKNVVAKKSKKKIASQKPSRKSMRSKPITKLTKEKPVGRVTHFFGNIKVVIVKCKAPFPRGARLHFKGATTDFIDTAVSIQYNHTPIAKTKKGQEVGIKVKKRVREGDVVYRVA